MTIFRTEDEARVRKLLGRLERPVELLVAHGPEETQLPGAARDIDFGAETERVVRELCELSSLLSVRVEEEPAGAAEGGAVFPPDAGSSADGASSLRFERYPAMAVLPEGRDAGVRFYGLPWGYELGSLLGAVLEAGRLESSLKPSSLERLDELDRDLAIDVFVTPT